MLYSSKSGYYAGEGVVGGVYIPILYISNLGCDPQHVHDIGWLVATCIAPPNHLFCTEALKISLS